MIHSGLRVLSILCLTGALSWAWRPETPALTRGPYLQDASATGAVLVCNTSSVSATTLRYGRHAGPPWEFERSSSAGTTHVFALEDLRPDTRYTYELSAGGAVLAQGPDCFFRTSPPEGSRAPFRFLAWGDSGTGTSTQLDVAARARQVVPEPRFVLGLGDLVYESGAASDYDPKLFQPYARLFSRLTFWPTLGNHDVETANGQPYLDAFYLPTHTGAPGHPSNTERYYSFDHGLAHFVCVDSETSSSSPGSAMYDWISDDLDDARTRGKRWLFAFLHKPPYTKGTHDSDREGDLEAVHDNLVPLFEARGVDLVLCGHSHVYERSYLLKNDAVLQNGADDYSKIDSPNGTLYLVSGCGGRSGTGPLDHPLMAASHGEVAGVSVIDVSYDEVRGYFLERDGRTRDLFTLHKAADEVAPRVSRLRAASASQVEVVFDEPVQAGTGLAGAENAANYRIAGATVQAATLGSDRHTVTLRTSALTAHRSYELSILRVVDRAGNAIDERGHFVLEDPGALIGSPVVPPGATWRYFKGSAAPPSSWTSRAFSDSGWGQGQAGFGYADGDDATAFTDMRGSYASVYLRTSFDVVTPLDVTGMQLSVSYDDGFVAYLNGVEVARANVPAGQTNTTLATSSHEAGGPETFDLGAFRNALVAGANVLAVEGHNTSLSSNDFSLHPALALTVSPGSGGSPVIPQGATWRYFKGSSAPPASWPASTFADSGWSQGQSGFGYEDGDDATVLADMKNNYASVYLRASFALHAPSAVTGMKLWVSYDDGFVAFLNGVEVARANVPANQTNTTFASISHEGGVFEPFDLGAYLGALVPGANTLAVEGHNTSLVSNDFSLHPWLALALPPPSGEPPVAVLESDIQTANSPALVRFSSARSAGGGSPLASARWDFGDGSPIVGGATVEHVYDRDGIFTATLMVEDQDGLEAIDRREIRIHSVGQGPIASLSASDERIDPGARVTFSSAGSRDPDGGSVFLRWDFGDPDSGPADHSTAASPSHVFAAEGTYEVVLTVIDDEGSEVTRRAAITVGQGDGPPRAAFGVRASGRDLLRLTFSDRSTGAVTSWLWDFGDGATSTQRDPVHNYAQPGLYTVALTVAGPDGSDRATKELQVGGPSLGVPPHPERPGPTGKEPRHPPTAPRPGDPVDLPEPVPHPIGKSPQQGPTPPHPVDPVDLEGG